MTQEVVNSKLHMGRFYRGMGGGVYREVVLVIFILFRHSINREVGRELVISLTLPMYIQGEGKGVVSFIFSIITSNSIKQSQGHMLIKKLKLKHRLQSGLRYTFAAMATQLLNLIKLGLYPISNG
jgi:hypothetical protein